MIYRKEHTFEDVPQKDFVELVKQHRVMSIDQFSGKDFNINAAGHVSSCISTLARAQSYDQFKAIVEQIGVNRNLKYGCNDKLSMKENISLIRSRYAQSYAELEQYSKQLEAMQRGALDDAYREALKDVKPGSPADKPAVEPVDKPSTVSE